MRIATATIALLILAWAFLASNDAEDAEAQAPDEGRIAFDSNRDGNWEIYVMNADGSGQTNLTNNPARDGHLQWSPDGRRIAFESDRDGNDEIYVMNADGSGVTNLTNNPGDDWSPSWSPDGRRIAFRSDRDGNDEIYVMNADGAGQPWRADSWEEFSLIYNSWSPDGRRIASWEPATADGFLELYVMNADGTGQTWLTTQIRKIWFSDQQPSWSPDGRRIAFDSQHSLDDEDPEIYVINADGSGQTRLTNNPANDWSPSWSPDGRRIAFSSDRDGNGEIYVMNADGSGVTNLTNNPAYDSSPSYRPAPPDDHGDSFSDATRIDINTSHLGNIETAGDTDFFYFRAESGHSYEILTALVTLSDSVMTLYDADRSIIDSNDDFDDGYRGSVLKWTASSSGTLYVEVNGFAAETGTYLLSVGEIPPTPTPTPTYTPTPSIRMTSIFVPSTPGRSCWIRDSADRFDSISDANLTATRPPTCTPTPTATSIPTTAPLPIPARPRTVTPIPTDTPLPTATPYRLSPAAPTPIPTPAPIPANESSPRPTVNIHGDLTRTHLDGPPIKVSLAIVHTILMEQDLRANLIVRVPNGWSLTASGFAQACTGVCNAVYDLKPGENKHVEMSIVPNQTGRNEIYAKIEWVLSDKTASDINEETISVEVLPDERSLTPTPVSPPITDSDAGGNGGNNGGCNPPLGNPANPLSGAGEMAIGAFMLGGLWALSRRNRRRK